MLYDTLVAKYEKLEATTKRLEMTDILAQLLKEVVPDEVEKVIYLTQGKIHPDWTGEPEIGMAEKMVVETIVNASGLSKKEVQALVAEKGDVGLAAEQAIREKRIGKLAGKVLTVGDIYTSLDQISKESGKGSSGRKMDRLVRLMVNTSGSKIPCQDSRGISSSRDRGHDYT
jgi:DNA ligase-1